MIDNNVKLAIESNQSLTCKDISKEFLRDCRVISQNKPKQAPRAHKKGSTLRMLETKDTIFVFGFERCLGDTINNPNASSEAKRKAQQWRTNVFRFTKEPPHSKFRQVIFTELHEEWREKAHLAAYIQRRAEKPARMQELQTRIAIKNGQVLQTFNLFE